MGNKEIIRLDQIIRLDHDQSNVGCSSDDDTRLDKNGNNNNTDNDYHKSDINNDKRYDVMIIKTILVFGGEIQQ